MKSSLKIGILNGALVLGLSGVVACAHHHHDPVPADGSVSTERDRDVSHNIFTGSKTVTDKESRTYENDDTGAKRKSTVTRKQKYDRDGRKVSDTQEEENSR
jgi:hypothetical protein